MYIYMGLLSSVSTKQQAAKTKQERTTKAVSPPILDPDSRHGILLISRKQQIHTVLGDTLKYPPTEVLLHTPPQSEELPRPCIADGCKFGHDPATVVADLQKLLAEEARLAADKTKNGKARYSAWRMLHAWKSAVPHCNVPPGLYGRPFFRHHFRKQILDALHLALLGLPKTPWKFGLKNNSSDDARAQMSDQLRAWKHPLDMKRKADERVKEQAWFTGESWISFCAGKAGSPGGAIAIATLVMIVADDLQLRGVDAGGEELPPPKPSVSGQRGRGAAALIRARGGARSGRGQGGGRAASFAELTSSPEQQKQTGGSLPRGHLCLGPVLTR